MVGLVGSVSSLGASLFSLYHSYDTLRLANVSLEQTHNKTSKALEAVEKNQIKVNALFNSGQGNTQKYANAVRDLAQAKTTYGIQLEKQTTTEEHAMQTTASFYLNVIPEAISTVGSLTSVASGVVQVHEALSKSTEEAR